MWCVCVYMSQEAQLVYPYALYLSVAVCLINLSEALHSSFYVRNYTRTEYSFTLRWRKQNISRTPSSRQSGRLGSRSSATPYRRLYIASLHPHTHNILVLLSSTAVPLPSLTSLHHRLHNWRSWEIEIYKYSTHTHTWWCHYIDCESIQRNGSQCGARRRTIRE